MLVYITARKYIVYRVAQTLHTKSYTDTYAETLVSGHIWGLVCEKTSMKSRMLCSIQRGRMRSSKNGKCGSI